MQLLHVVEQQRTVKSCSCQSVSSHRIIHVGSEFTSESRTTVSVCQSVSHWHMTASLMLAQDEAVSSTVGYESVTQTTVA